MLIIGEKINATSKSVAQAIARKDAAYIVRLAVDQVEAGADYLDVNAATGQGTQRETEDLEWVIDVVTSRVDKPLCVDSSDPVVLTKAIELYENRCAMINSVSAEPARLDAVGRAAAGRGLAVIALPMGEGGIPPTVEGRMAAAERIASHLDRCGVKPENIYFDPLVLPISVNIDQGRVTLKTIELLKTGYPSAKTVIGLSNVSYGLPHRRMVNRAFLLMATAAGLDAAILDPTDISMMTTVRIARMLYGKDPACRGFLNAYRQGKLIE